MRIVVHPLTTSTLGDLAGTAATSMFWIAEPGTHEHLEAEVSRRLDKEVWLHHMLTTWGPCALTAYVTSGDNENTAKPAATVFFAPPNLLPGQGNFRSGPASPDAILISNVHLDEAYVGLFLETQLVEAVIDELSRRGVKAVEAFARGDETLDSTIPVLDVEVLEETGFRCVQADPEFPRYRLELTEKGNLFAAVEENVHEGTATMGLGERWRSRSSSRTAGPRWVPGHTPALNPLYGRKMKEN